MPPQKNKKAYKILSSLVLVCLILNFILFGFLSAGKVYAQAGSPAPPAATMYEQVIQYIQEKLHQAWEKISAEYQKAIDHAGAVAYKTGLIYFLRTLSVDTATWLASGGKGQQPMFITEGWGAYLADVADGAAGEFIETFVSETGKNQNESLSAIDNTANQCSENCDATYNSCSDNCNTAGFSDQACVDQCNISSSTCFSKCVEEYGQGYNKLTSVGQTVYGGNTSATGVMAFLCQPNLQVKLQIAMGLAEIQRPRKPACTVSSMMTNWDNFINDPNFLKRFQDYFDPHQNDLGIALTLQTNLLEETAKKTDQAEKERQTTGGVKAITDLAGNIITPAKWVEAFGLTPITNATKPESIYLKDIAADTISTFASTLIGQLFQRWIKEGMAQLHGQGSGSIGSIIGGSGGSSDYSANLYNFETGYPYGGTEAAKAHFMKIFQPTFSPGGTYEVLQKLVSCPDANNPGPDECVITEKFRTAIEKQMTIKEALDQGYLDGTLTFGFNAQGYEPLYNQGYPYRSLIILRKHRIIPVGWELAAYWIGNFQGTQPRSYNLNDLIKDYSDPNSPFYKLIDPNWVLKAPEGYCRKEAPGEKINSLTVAEGVDINKDGKYDSTGESPPKIALARASYCADDQSCIVENPDGTCKYYGYCTEEKRQWKFSGQACDQRWTSCQTFQDRQGKMVNYLKNSLDFNGCNSENYGCSWYCQNFSPTDKYWSCSGPNMSYQKCNNPTGCQVSPPPGSPYSTKSCLIPYNGITCDIPTCQSQGNLISNGDLEQGTKYVLNNWTTSFYDALTEQGFHKDSAKKHSGTNSLMFYAVSLAGNYSATNNILVKSDTSYDVSGWVYNSLNSGLADVSATINGSISSCGVLPKNSSSSWQQFNCNVSSGVATSILLSLNVSLGADPSINGSIWFDNIEVKEQCASEPVKLFLNNGSSILAPGNSIYFDHNAETCSSSAEGCSEFLRLQLNSGANLMPNGNFEEFSGAIDDGADDTVYNWQGAGQIVSDKYAGSYALKINQNGQIVGTAFAGASIYSRHFILSLYAKNCQTADDYKILGGPNAIAASKQFDGSNEWKRYTLDYLFPPTAYCSATGSTCFNDSDCPNGETCNKLGKFVRVEIDSQSGSCLIDNAQVEEADSSSPTSYKDYGMVDKTYLKKAPDYYNCYDSNPDNNFAECQNYALSCSEEEVDCQKYTPINGDPAVPGVAKADDICPAECVGYDTYKQKATSFGQEPATLDYFIPKSQKSCSAKAVGCSEFTNLDEINKGGEAREYYTYLRQCVKPDNTCATFYTWVGSETSGYQLMAYNLVDADGNGEPDEISNPLDLGNCANVDDAIANPECKEFYSTNGAISYHIYRNTIACSDDCHPLRISQSNQNDCGKTGGNWDGQVCVYSAIPAESNKCSATEVGCREYKGNTSYNKMTVVKDTFEQGVNDWGGGTLSGESLTVGGHSLNVSNVNISYNLNVQCSLGANCSDDNGCLCQVGGQDVCLVAKDRSSCTYKQLLNKDRTYLLSFWAKGRGSLTIKFGSADCNNGQCFSGGTTPTAALTADWHLYNLGPVYANWDVAMPDSLDFSGFGNNSFMDNIILTEVRDDIFVVKTTPWNVPAVCNEDKFGGSFPQYTLGCKAYKSSANKIVNLKSFTNLCGDDKIGCEALIDTKNSTSPFEQIYNTGDRGEAVVTADEVIYLVNDSKKSCQSSDKGCQLFGAPTIDQNEKPTSWQSIFIKNNPDNYNKTLCRYSEIGCEKYSTDKGDYYFKDPKNKVCEYKLKQGEKDYAWYKINSGEKCNTVATEFNQLIPAGQCLNSGKDGDTCAKDEDCQDENFPDAYCSRWAGSCPKDQSSCTEFIDPESSFAKNILFNGNFSQDVDSNGADGWSTDGNHTGAQLVNLEANTLYTISAATPAGSNLTILAINLENCQDQSGAPSDLTTPDNSINLENSPKLAVGFGVCSNNHKIQCANDTDCGSGNNCQYIGNYSARFYTGKTTKCAINLPAFSSPDNFKNHLKEVNLKKTGAYYYLADTIDQTSCNGIVNFKDGCVLFNKRDIISSAGYANLSYNTDNSSDGNPPDASCGSGNKFLCNSNTLIKVRPDRTCDKWLYCRSLIETKTTKGETQKNCLDVGLCDGVNERGECNSFPKFQLPGSNEDLTYQKASADQLKDLAGYVKVGYDWGVGKTLVGDRLFSNMSQKGGESSVPNGTFEESSGTGVPYGWVDTACNTLKVIDNPLDSQKEGLGQRAPEGVKFLRIAGGCNATTELLDITQGTDNVVSAWLNTLNLSTGTAEVAVEQYDNNGTSHGIIMPKIELGKGLGWTLKSITFRPAFPRIKIKISGGSEGRFYADDIKVSAVLNHQGTAPNEKYTPSSCRGYPDEQSLGCDYKDDSGVKKFGWWGYCLEHDRKPANPDQCLIWWPVDIIKGKDIEEISGAGYDDRYPLYYCMEFLAKYKLVEYRPASTLVCYNQDTELSENDYPSAGDCHGCGCRRTNGAYCPNGYVGRNTSGCGGAFSCDEWERWYCDAIGGGGWYEYDGDLQKVDCCGYCDGDAGTVNEASNGVKWLDTQSGDRIDINDINFPCVAISQVVTPVGQQKAWRGRVFQGSNYTVPSLGYKYNTSESPFAALQSIATNENNPTSWNLLTVKNAYSCVGAECDKFGVCDNGSGKMCYISPTCGSPTNPVGPLSCSGGVCVALPTNYSFAKEKVSRLFAKSYGGWKWSGGSYAYNANYNWSEPTNICGPTRPAYPNDYCAVLPRVDNIRIGENPSGNICVKNNGFVNLTFNSVIDSQQQPMVAYSILWGDGEANSVNGVSMQNRPNPENPHSLHHLYGYWDLKAKKNSNDPNINIECAGAGGAVFTATCPTDSACCAIRPQIQIKDNWGWCSGGAFINDCSKWASYNGYIIVTEKSDSGC